MTTKDTNPKDLIASTKLPLHLVPDTLAAYAALSFAEGASKYGAFNWRRGGARASVYRSALSRHLAKWWNGEACDPRTNVPHLASVAACVAVLIDAELCGVLVDDRPPPVPRLSAWVEDQETRVRELYAMHAHLNPHHHTIHD